MNISSRQIIAEAWDFTQSNKKLIIWYAFVPAVLTTLVGIVYVGYQYFAFVSSPLFQDWDQSFLELIFENLVLILGQNFEASLPFIVTIAVIGLMYLIVPSICEGSIIQLVARKRNGQDVRTRDGIRYGLMSFLPIFEYSWLVRTFNWITLLTWVAFVMRNLGPEAAGGLMPIIIVFFIAGIVLTLLFTYTEFYIVIDGRRMIESVAKSSGLVIMHLEKTLLLAILMLIIGIRVIIQVLFVLLIPAIMIAIVYFIAAGTIPIFAMVIAGIVGLVLLYIASYLSATIHVFAATVWTFTFLELTHEEEVSAREQVEA